MQIIEKFLLVVFATFSTKYITTRVYSYSHACRFSNYGLRDEFYLQFFKNYFSIFFLFWSIAFVSVEIFSFACFCLIKFIVLCSVECCLSIFLWNHERSTDFFGMALHYISAVLCKWWITEGYIDFFFAALKKKC